MCKSQFRLYSSVVRGVYSHLFCGHSNFIYAPSLLRLCKVVRVQLSDPYKKVGKTSVFYIFKIVSVLTFLKIEQSHYRPGQAQRAPGS